ncbi:penicillin-binding protein 2 [Ammoniphilus sp. YIM 78166]|uniref:peptidoglycan D,D-transpeptidase FtsI family protein n=1 Tax=Ammoniphilus sp. YIM 78166 TaxID=1644106 RepID=UPI001430EB7A|nr:penicillin-binding transpeptidase domain-containing protein [Ammoniphilus sp. YIM 78166]
MSSKRRMFFTLSLLVTAWVVLISRLMWIQILDVHQFSKHGVNLIEEAVTQRKQEVTLHTGRGDILDRNGQPLTGSERTGVAVFPLVRGNLDKEKIARLAELTDLNEDQLHHVIQQVRVPTFIRDSEGKIIALNEMNAQEVDQLSLPGIVSLPITERYQPDALATQLVGYISQNPERIQKEYAEELKRGEITKRTLIGASGLERSFERFLQGVGPTTVSYFVDARGNPLNGLKSKMVEQENQFYPLAIKTTLNKDLQKLAEESLLHEGVALGSVVVLDAKSREVLAMASHPVFHPGSRIELENGNWVNRSIKQISPGSVFKTVVAAAVLEEGVVKPDDKFHCEGHYGKYGFSCWKEGGHGEITFAEAFAQSCNIAFAHAALKLQPGDLEKYAEKLGLTQQVGWSQSPFFKMNTFRQLDGEDRGQIFSAQTPRQDEGVLIQTAIGQRDVQITPLQAANMMATILEGGEKEEVRVVKEIRYKTGSLFHSFEAHPIEGEQIDRYTAYQLRKMMESVVDSGTAQTLKDSLWKLAGKTGTAQTNSGKNNQWFVGYGPVENPQYVVVAVAEQEPKSGPNKVIPVVKRIMNELAVQQDSSHQLRP